MRDRGRKAKAAAEDALATPAVSESHVVGAADKSTGAQPDDKIDSLDSLDSLDPPDEDQEHMKKMTRLLTTVTEAGFQAIFIGTLPGEAGDDYVIATDRRLIASYYKGGAHRGDYVQRMRVEDLGGLAVLEEMDREEQEYVKRDRRDQRDNRGDAID